MKPGFYWANLGRYKTPWEPVRVLEPRFADDDKFCVEVLGSEQTSSLDDVKIWGPEIFRFPTELFDPQADLEEGD